MAGEINPGIRETVAFLNQWGFRTTDSGDGKTHDYECDREYPYVVLVTEPKSLIAEADRLVSMLAANGINLQAIHEDMPPSVQASYDPISKTAVIELMCVDDALLAKAQGASLKER